MNRLWVLAVVVAAFVGMNWASNGSIGASSECVNGQCVVSASSSWVAVVTAMAAAVFARWYPQRACSRDASRVVGVWRRFGAFLVDFALVLMIMSPLAALPVLVVEAKYVEVFQWSFRRDYSRPTDWVYFLGALSGFVALVFYFYQHGKSGRATVGQYVLNYRVVPAAGGHPSYAWRAVLSFIGLCMWPVSVILALRHSQKTFWWDGATNTEVVRVVG